MSVTFRCGCGRRLLATTDDRTVTCPVCRRTAVRVGGRLIWAAVSVVVVCGVAVGVIAARPKPVAESARAETIPPPVPPAKPDAPAPRQPQPAVPIPQLQPDPPVRPAPVPVDPPRGVLKAAPADHRFKAGDTFDQEVVISRRAAVRVLSVETGQAAEYAFTSAFKIVKVNADGSLTAEQTIRAAKLITADADTKAALADTLSKTEGAKFDLTVSATGEVTALKGADDPIRVKVGRDANFNETFRLWSLLDADAWKELAGLTFFVPEQQRRGAKWTRPLSHDWGPLGSWRGNTVYTAAGEQPGKRGVERVEYVHDLSHCPADGKAGLDLPIRVRKSQFKPLAAGGVIVYDPAVKRVTAAEEQFRVAGAVVASAVGTDVTVELEERQGFRLTVTEPAVRQMVGRQAGGR